jgi:hypothetical protein
MDLSCVNEEIKAYNRKMHKIMKLESNVKILDIKLDHVIPGMGFILIQREKKK